MLITSFAVSEFITVIVLNCRGNTDTNEEFTAGEQITARRLFKGGR